MFYPQSFCGPGIQEADYLGTSSAGYDEVADVGWVCSHPMVWLRLENPCPKWLTHMAVMGMLVFVGDVNSSPLGFLHWLLELLKQTVQERAAR